MTKTAAPLLGLNLDHLDIWIMMETQFLGDDYKLEKEDKNEVYVEPECLTVPGNKIHEVNENMLTTEIGRGMG